MITNLILIGLGCCIIIPLWILIDKKDKWIEINKQLPKKYKPVLVYCVPKYVFEQEGIDFDIYIGYMESDNEWYLYDQHIEEIKHITHWKELPKKP